MPTHRGYRAPHRGCGLALLLTLGLGGWSGASALPARDPDVADHWYPVACRVWAEQLGERVSDLRTTGRIDAPDASHFQAAIRRCTASCAANGFDTLHLLISLEGALRDWHVGGKGL